MAFWKNSIRLFWSISFSPISRNEGPNALSALELFGVASTPDAKSEKLSFQSLLRSTVLKENKTRKIPAPPIKMFFPKRFKKNGTAIQNAMEGVNKNRSPNVEPIMIKMFDTTDMLMKKNKTQ